MTLTSVRLDKVPTSKTSTFFKVSVYPTWPKELILNPIQDIFVPYYLQQLCKFTYFAH